MTNRLLIICSPEEAKKTLEFKMKFTSFVIENIEFQK